MGAKFVFRITGSSSLLVAKFMLLEWGNRAYAETFFSQAEKGGLSPNVAVVVAVMKPVRSGDEAGREGWR